MAGKPAGSAPTQAQPGLFVVDGDGEDQDEPRTGRRQTLRHERAINAALRDTGLDRMPRLAAAITLARGLAAQLDIAERRRDPFAASQIAPRLHEVLKDLGLFEHGGQSSEGGGMLDGLGAATVVDTEDT